VHNSVAVSEHSPADVARGGGSKAFQNFGPQAAVHRPGLARATPSLNPDDLYDRNDDHMHATTAATGESKRKRVDDEGSAYDDAVQLDSVKWRAVDDEYAAQPPSKPSTRAFHPSIPCFFFSAGLTCFPPPPPPS
jgi:hypothetical protein